MKKTGIMAICMAMTAMLSACGSGSGSDSQSENISDSSSSAAVTESSEQGEESVNEGAEASSNVEASSNEEASSGEEASSEEEASEEETQIDGYNSDVKEYQFRIPGDYKYYNHSGSRLWQYDLASGKKAYYSLINVPDYAHSHPDETYTLDNAQDILWEFMLTDMAALKFPAGASGSECVVDTDEKKEMLGNEVIRRTGTFKLTRYGETVDLAYAAYYMVADMQNGDYPKVPVVWFAFSEDTGDEAKAFLADSVDFTFENTEIAS